MIQQAPQQDAHAVPPLWFEGPPPAEVHLRQVQLPRQAEEEV